MSTKPVIPCRIGRRFGQCGPRHAPDTGGHESEDNCGGNGGSLPLRSNDRDQRRDARRYRRNVGLQDAQRADDFLRRLETVIRTLREQPAA